MARALVRTLIGVASILILLPPVLSRELTFDERGAAQVAIEQVYWEHRVWPTENPGPKPHLSSVMPESVIRAKVADYLRKSNALATIWQRPITADQLQAELDRMASQTRAPNVLQELFAALGNDPLAIAETLASGRRWPTG